MPDDSRIEKLVWDDGDFEQSGWRDATLYAVAFSPGEFELSLDLDYICEWAHRTKGGSLFQFCVAPSTLVFWDVHNLHVDADFYSVPMVSIDSLYRGEPRKPKMLAISAGTWSGGGPLSATMQSCPFGLSGSHNTCGGHRSLPTGYGGTSPSAEGSPLSA